MTLRRPLALVLALVCAAPAAALTGREVIDQAQTKHKFSSWHYRTARSSMANYDDGDLVRTRELEIMEETDPRGEHRTFIHFTGPLDVQGTRFLHLSPRGDKDQQWLFAPLTRRVRRIGDSQRDENFFGSDLSYRDLELLVRIQQWNDEEAKATLIGEETVDGKAAHVVELVPNDNEEFPYSRYRLWFGKDDLLLLRVDIYEGDAVLKRVTPSKYTKVGDYSTAMEADVANLNANSNTRFEFSEVVYDVEIPDKTFTVGNLER
jgi:outer membrane lipoprotein-sorting protein